MIRGSPAPSGASPSPGSGTCRFCRTGYLHLRLLRPHVLLCILAGLTTANVAVAQEVPLASVKVDSTVTYRFEMRSGSMITGQVISVSDETIGLRTSGIGSILLARSEIVRVLLLNQSNQREGRYWFPNPHATRYLVGPSAIQMRKGEGYYQNTYLFLNSAAYGITNHVSVTGGFELLSTLGKNSNGPIYYLSARGGAQVVDKLHVGGMATYLSIPNWFADDSDGERGSFGAVAGMATYGTADAQLTGGAGWGYSSSGLSQRPVLTFSALVRLSRGIALLSENWMFPVEQQYNGIYSYGLRFMGESVAVDLAFINNKDIGEWLVIGIPFIDFVVKF